MHICDLCTDLHNYKLVGEGLKVSLTLVDVLLPAPPFSDESKALSTMPLTCVFKLTPFIPPATSLRQAT